MSVTEIALLPLQADKIPDDTTSAAGQVHCKALEICLAQPGAQRIYWGRPVEDPLVLTWFFDWNDVEDHKTFMNSDAYKPFLEAFGSLLGPGARAFHARFNPHPATGALGNSNSPVTEISTLYYPVTISREDQEVVQQSIKQYISVQGAQGNASTGGWVDEEIDIPGLEEKGKAYVLLTGWESLDASVGFKRTKPHQDAIILLQGSNGLKKLESVHVSFTKASKES